MRDRLNILSKLTLRRGMNALKVMAGFYFSRLVRRPYQWGLPVSIAIEPTTSCNLRCPECPSGKRDFTRPTGMLDEAFFRSVIDQASAHAFYLTFYFQGEPYLHPQFNAMVNYASRKKMYTSTSTNAHYLDEVNAEKTVRSGLDRLIISMDGTTQETYEQYRVGGSLQKVMEGVRNVVRWKRKLNSKTPHVIFQFLVMRPNEHQVSGVKKIADELGVDEVIYKAAQVYDYQHGNELIPLNTNYARYKKNADGIWSLKNRMENHCRRMWQGCVITWDGKVVPCCFDKDAQHRLGELGKKSLREVWFGEAYYNFRAALLRSRNEIDICANCSEGSVVGVEV